MNVSCLLWQKFVNYVFVKLGITVLINSEYQYILRIQSYYTSNTVKNAPVAFRKQPDTLGMTLCQGKEMPCFHAEVT